MPAGVPVKTRSPGSRVQAAGAVLLTDLSVHLAADGQIVGVVEGVEGDDRGPDRTVGVRRLAHRELGRPIAELECPVRNVLTDAVARHVLQCLAAGNEATAASDHGDQLHLVVDVPAGQHHIGARPRDAARELREDERLLRNVESGLGRVGLVVEADAEDLRRTGDAGGESRLVEARILVARLEARGPVPERWPAREHLHRIRGQLARRAALDIHHAIGEKQARPPTDVRQPDRHPSLRAPEGAQPIWLVNCAMSK
jgi:hypothetical protein